MEPSRSDVGADPTDSSYFDNAARVLKTLRAQTVAYTVELRFTMAAADISSAAYKSAVNETLKAVAAAVNRELVAAALKGGIAEGEIDAGVIPLDISVSHEGRNVTAARLSVACEERGLTQIRESPISRGLFLQPQRLPWPAP